jgi:hypothetical protein
MVINEFGFSTDEIEKADAAESYLNFDFSDDPSHPALMKLAITLSVLIFGNTEFTVRLPNVIVGALTVFPIFLLGRILYDEKTGLLASLLWAVSIPVISFSTTAKEDTFLTFFWVLAIYFFVKARENPTYFRHSGVFVGLAAASKYITFLLVVTLLILYFFSIREGVKFPSIKETALLSVPYGIISFVIANSVILYPETLFKLIEHHVSLPPKHSGWIMMGTILPNRPPFYLQFHILLKDPILSVLFIFLGIIIAIKTRSSSDKILLTWIAIVWGFFSIPTILLFARYNLVIYPALLILAVQAVFRLSNWLFSRIKRFETSLVQKSSIASILIIMTISLNSILLGVTVTPYYRMYVNELGGGSDNAGYYFPNDSVWDFYLREAIQYVNERAPQGSTIAMTEVVDVGEYYGRPDIQFMYLVDLPADIDHWNDYNLSYVIIQESRTYYENQFQIKNLQEVIIPEKSFIIFETTVVEVFNLENLY